MPTVPMNVRCIAVFLAASFLAGPVAAGAPGTDASLATAVTGGKLTLNLRPRYETVSQDGKLEDAHALTNRTLLGWRTLAWHGVSLYAEAIDVTRIGDHDFNDSPVASARFPTVADPDNTDVNQLYVDYEGVPGTRVRAGRMALKLDNVRFVGNVEFRQVMQVFNGVFLENRSIRGLELDYAHFWRVKNVFTQQLQTRLDLFRAAYEFAPGEQIVGFAYLQDQPVTGQATGFADNSNRIVGVRLNGAHAVATPWKVLYTAEYARQDPYAGGDARIDADYWRLGMGAQWKATYVRVDYDRLGSNNGLYAFQTPLGTNHLFQGWADNFLTTPATGIRDRYVTAGTEVAGVKVVTEWHDFRSDVGGLRYGREWDVGVSYGFSSRLTGKVEYASFREGDVLTPGTARKRDLTKLWVTLVYNY